MNLALRWKYEFTKKIYKIYQNIKIINI
jgi:hypothetical protein